MTESAAHLTEVWSGASSRAAAVSVETFQVEDREQRQVSVSGCLCVVFVLSVFASVVLNPEYLLTCSGSTDR